MKERVWVYIQEYSELYLTLAYLELRHIYNPRHIQNSDIFNSSTVFRFLSNILPCLSKDTPSQSVLDVWLDSESDYVFINVT